jgi:hypothetical protein
MSRVSDVDGATAAAPEFRTATTADVGRIVALVESAYRGDSSRTGWTTEADLLDGQRTDEADVTAAVTDGNGRMILAEIEGGLVACCLVHHRGTHAYFGMFAVSPKTLVRAARVCAHRRDEAVPLRRRALRSAAPGRSRIRGAGQGFP